MQLWMTLWTILLVVSCGTFLGMMVLVGRGAVRELRETLSELKEDTREAREHPEILDQEI